MGAGECVGRIGGLAVALGIGAAVFTGQGVASADTSDGADAPSTGSSTSESASSSTDDSPKPEENSVDEKPDTATDSSDEEKPADAPRKKKRSDDAPTTRTGRTERSEVSTAATAQTTSKTTPKTESTKSADESPAEEAKEEAEEAKEEATPAAKEEAAPAADVVVTETVVEQEAPTATEPDPGDPVTVAISTVVNALFNPGADTAPTAPVDSPAEWALLAAARRDFGTARTLDTGVSQETTNSLVTANSLVAADAEPVDPAASAASVVAIDAPPILGWVQQVPIIGPLFMTPIVGLIKQIPFIGDILHPIFGYPLGYTGGTTPRDVRVISFDGTPIYVHFFPAQGSGLGTKAPTILNGPGLSLPGETNPLAARNPFLPNDVIGMAPLLQSGYNVVTWDPRGEWSSGGVLQIDHPDFEARDVSAIISWLSQQPEVLLDSPGDPRLGMVGASYGGGIQLVTAAIDKRMDAIVPTIAWNRLGTSLNKNDAPKTSWGALLTAALTFTLARINPQIYPPIINGLLWSELSDADKEFLALRGPDQYLDRITAPTLLFQGTVDTLFTLDEAHRNAMALIGNGVETKVVWYCGGHGACISSRNDGELIERETLEWLNRYVKQDLSVDPGPQFEWVDQHGQEFSSDEYPIKKAGELIATSGAGGVLPLVPVLGGSGPQFRAFEPGPIAGLLGVWSGAYAANAVNLKTPAAATTTYIVGAPQLSFTYSGTGTARHVYAQLVDNTTGLVLGNLVTPIPVTLDGESHTVDIPLEMVAHTLRPGESVTVQLVASAVQYESIWSLGALNVSNMTLALPIADPTAISAPSQETTSAA